jgi:predicted ABC-type ATPase
MPKKKILIVAGPNGVGKTTFARSFLQAEAECLRFINADLIASGLSPFAPEAQAVRAGRIMLEEIFQCVDNGESFAIETTLSGQGYRRHIGEWQSLGYHVSIYFLALLSPELAIARVAERVRQGGHHIPENVIRRRFESGRKNFDNFYREIVDSWILYDNTGASPVPIEWSK